MNRFLFLLELVLCGSWFVLVPEMSLAQTDAIESARRALKSTRQPWFDAESDGLKPLLVKESDKATRQDWRGLKRPEWTWSPNWNWWTGGAGPGISIIGELFKLVAWTVLIILLAALIYVLVQTFLDTDSQTLQGVRSSSKEDNTTHEQRIENLPIQLKSKQGDFLEIARQYYQDGDFAEAMVYLFSHRLMLLDKAGCIRLTKGKTNLQYLSELRDTDLRKILGPTIVAFEDVFFGKHSLQRERFEQCWNRNDQFQTILAQGIS